MATMSKFPPDVERNINDATDEAQQVASGLKAKASDLTDRATETVKDGYYRAKDALTDMDPVETARESGEAVIRAVERHPLVAFGLGALSVGLIAWSSMRQPRQNWWERYQPDYSQWRDTFSSLAGDAQSKGEGALKTSDQWLRSYGDQARSYADHGSRLISNQAQKEPLAAMVGIGLAIYVVGSLLTSAASANDEPPPPRRRNGRRS